jgi:hypothetical protein
MTLLFVASSKGPLERDEVRLIRTRWLNPGYWLDNDSDGSHFLNSWSFLKGQVGNQRHAPGK